jgi:putrescine transport system substrate-binding protein
MHKINMSAILAAAVLTAQAGWAEEVRVYNWSDYIDEDLLAQFE